MKKTEIEFLRSAGYSIEEIMAMYPVQNAENKDGSSHGSAAVEEQNAQKEAEPQNQPAEQPAAQPATPSQSPAGGDQSAAPSDQSAVILAKLDSLIAAIQAGNRAASNATPPVKQSAEEIAAQLI